MRKSVFAATLVGAMCTGLVHAQIIGAPATDVKEGTIGIGLDYGEQKYEMTHNPNFAGGPDKQYDVKLKGTVINASYGIPLRVDSSAAT